MGEKTAGVGHFTIPTSPAAGASCTSGAANVYTTTYVQLIASTAAAIFITGIYVQRGSAAPTYVHVQLATGAAASETIVGQHAIALPPTIAGALAYKPIYPPIPVANAARISCKTADSAGATATLITLECINQSNVVDDGVAVATVTTVTNQLTAAAIATGVWQDSTAGDFATASSIGKSLFTTGAVPGATGGLFIAGTNAATTITTGLTTTFTGNLTGSVGSVTGSVGSVTGAVGSVTGAVGSVTGNVGGNVVGSVASVTAAVSVTGDLSAAMKTSVTTACTASTPTAAAVTGAVGSVTGNVGGNVIGSVGSVVGAVGSVTAAVLLPSIPANWITAAGVNAAALNGKGDWNIGKTGYALTAAYDAAKTASQAGDAMALTAGERTALTAAVWAYVVAGTTTAVQGMRGFMAAMMGKASGLSTNAPKYRDIADTKNVIDVTSDANGNRSAVTLDLT